MPLTALIIGATGATGRQLVQQLLNDDAYSNITVFVRREMPLQHPKLTQHVVDFDNIAAWQHLFTGYVLFSALGTTRKLAKTKAKQYKVDYTAQYETAKAAAENGVTTYVLVSAYGANPKSIVFYSRMKGQLEQAVEQLPFKHIHIFQPGILDRNTNDGRAMETFSLKFIRFVNRLGILKSQRPMPVNVLAEKMRRVAAKPATGRVNRYRLSGIFSIVQ